MRSSSEIQTDLDAAYEARRAALSAQSYSLDTGQGKQTVSRANLSDINKMIRDLELELESSICEESGTGGLVSGNFRRH